TTDDAAMLLQFQAVSDSAEALRRSLGPHPSDELDSALVRLGSLSELRENARSRGIALDSVARAYHAVIEALIDALRLVPRRSTGWTRSCSTCPTRATRTRYRRSWPGRGTRPTRRPACAGWYRIR